MKSVLGAMGIVLVLAVAGAGAFVYSGVYNVAADDPHWDITSRLMETLRTRSIDRRASDVKVPDLTDQQSILKGAGLYAAMCASCHLAPGVKPNELSKGLYPEPPVLSKRKVDPRVGYVVIKHGIKMTGMPAWGGHGDEQIWSLIAFLARLPDLSPKEYQEYIRSPEANTAAAMASHGSAMTLPQMGGSRGPGPAEAMHATPGHHEMPGTGNAR
jgi:mono/diheme cytochrome c family protein